jgi:hypothetical protein
MAIITTKHGLEILVDDGDFEFLNQWRWSVSRGYAVRRAHGTNVRMHRLLLELQLGEYTDHMNGNRLDNRRVNLRAATISQNNRNRASRGSISGYRGVSWHKAGKCWEARISVDRKDHRLGLFKDPVEAAQAYDFSARDLHGDFARLNFP